MNATSFRNFVPAPFLSAEQKEARALEKIEKARQARENERGVMLRLGALKDALETAKTNSAQQCANIDAACKGLTPEQYAADILRGVPLERIGTHIAAFDALAQRAESIKAALQTMIVGVAEKALTDFEKTHAKIIAKFPPLQKAPAPEFVPAPPARDWGDEHRPAPPSDGVRLMLNLRPGETVPAPAWEKPDSGQIKISNLDAD